MKVQRRTPTGTEPAFVFSSYTDGASGARVEDIPTYAPSPEGTALRELRRELGLTLSEAATALGCGVVDVGELERGISEPAAPHTWTEAVAALRGARATARVLEDIAAERQRQLEQYDRAHDDGHPGGELANAAALLASTVPVPSHAAEPIWAWDLRQKLAADRRRQLVVAAALLVAEIERLDRGTLGHLGPDGNVYATADHDPEVASVIGQLVSRG